MFAKIRLRFLSPDALLYFSDIQGLIQHNTIKLHIQQEKTLFRVKPIHSRF